LRHFADTAFWAAYEKLPRRVRQIADRNYSLLKQDSRPDELEAFGEWFEGFDARSMTS
jgi:hypothetical protein